MLEATVGLSIVAIFHSIIMNIFNITVLLYMQHNIRIFCIPTFAYKLAYRQVLIISKNERRSLGFVLVRFSFVHSTNP